jgi:hypothetical protein
MHKLTLLIVGLCLGTVACQEEENKPVAPPPAPAPAPAAAATSAQPAAPEMPQLKMNYAIEVVSNDAGDSIVRWSAPVPTGGWRLITDSVLVEDAMGDKKVARVWATLEQPNPSEMVTQAFTTVTGEHNAGKTKIDKTELSIRRTTRGVKSDFAPTYAVVKSAGY